LADSSAARLYEARGLRIPWTLVQEFEHPQSRAKGRDLLAERPGRAKQRMSANRSSTEPRTPVKEVEAGRFARMLAKAVEDGVSKKACHQIALVAPPHFMGLLRKQLSPRARKLVTILLEKDYLQLDAKEVAERVRRLF
jgi:protein required for attachment to host cells